MLGKDFLSSAKVGYYPRPYPWPTIAPPCTGVIGMGAVIDMLWNVNILMKNCLVIFFGQTSEFLANSISCCAYLPHSILFNWR